MAMNKRIFEQRFLRAEAEMQAAIMLLPPHLSEAYQEVMQQAPQLVLKESNPRWFLRFHNFDPKLSALRIANYWHHRREIFQERAFLPIDLSGTGAMTSDDIKVLRTGYFINLPVDRRSRKVLYVDMSRKSPGMFPSPRTIFFALQTVMEAETARQDGFVVVFNISNPFSANFVMPNLKRAKVLMDDCLLIRSYRFHVIHIPAADFSIDPTFIETIYAWARDRLGSIFGKASIVPMVASSQGECLAKLLDYELLREGLPVGLGGTWTGGCEPWRKGAAKEGDDELSLEIDLDLSCLLRNTLWCHNQTVSKHNSHKSSSSSSSSSSHDTGGSPSVTQYAAAVESPAKGKPFATSVRQFSVKDEKPAAIPQSAQNNTFQAMDTSPLFSGGGASLDSASVNVTTGAGHQILQPPQEQLLRTQQVQKRRSHAPSPITSSSHASSITGGGTSSSITSSTTNKPTTRRVETEEDKDKRRKRDVVYAKRKRERKKIEIQVLNEERTRLTASKEKLRAEGDRLEELLRQAKEEVERHESSGQNSSTVL